VGKAKYGFWLTEEGGTQLRAWALNGLTDEQIADKMEVSASTLYNWKRKYPEIADALKENKERADDALEVTLYDKAKAGNIGALIFWLKNRRPGKWRCSGKALERPPGGDGYSEAFERALDEIAATIFMEGDDV